MVQQRRNSTLLLSQTMELTARKKSTHDSRVEQKELHIKTISVNTESDLKEKRSKSRQMRNEKKV